MPLNANDRKSKLNQVLEDITDSMRRELASEQPSKRYRAKWSGGSLQSFEVVMKKSRKDASGTLRKSISHKVVERGDVLEGSIDMEEYGIYVNMGREPGKGMPVDLLQEWMRVKRIKPRDSRGRFVEATNSNLNSLSFLINRKIKTFGIEPFPFIDKSVRAYEPELGEKMADALIEDILNNFRNKYGI